MSIVPQNVKDLNQGILHLWSKFSDPSFNGGELWVRKSSKWDKFWLLSWIWPCRSRSITPKRIQILTRVFYTSGPNLVLLRVMSYRADKLRVDAHTRTHRQTQATTIPEVQNWPRVIKCWMNLIIHCHTSLGMWFLIHVDPSWWWEISRHVTDNTHWSVFCEISLIMKYHGNCFNKMTIFTIVEVTSCHYPARHIILWLITSNDNIPFSPPTQLPTAV